MNKERLEAMMDCTNVLAKLSKCDEIHVACLLVNDKLDQILSIGVNGGPAKGPQCMCVEGTKESCTHAEINALIKNRSDKVHYAFCSLFPCKNCQIALANAGVKVIIYYSPWKKCAVIPQAPFVIRRYKDCF